VKEKLKQGMVQVSNDRIVYYCNLKLDQVADGSASRLFLENALHDLEDWMVGETNSSFYSPLTMIIPENEIKPLEKASPFKPLAPHTPLIIKGIFSLAAILLLALLNTSGTLQLIVDFFNSLM
jgi:hypothetical protein